MAATSASLRYCGFAGNLWIPRWSRLSSFWFRSGFALVSLCAGFGSFGFALNSFWVRFEFASISLGFALVRFGFALVSLCAGFGSFGFASSSFWVRFEFALVLVGFASGSLWLRYGLLGSDLGIL